MSKVYVLVDERLMAAKNAKRSRHPRHFVVAAYSSMKKAQEAADGYLEALSFAPQGQGWKQGKLKGEITKTESSGKKSDKYGSLHATYRDDEAVLGHLRILTLTVNQPPEDEIDYMTAETFGADEVAYAVMWEGKEDDNEGLIYGIEYMDGEEVSDVEWFATAKERDAELKSYIEEFGAEGVKFELIPEVYVKGIGIMSGEDAREHAPRPIVWDSYSLMDDDAAEEILSIPADSLQEGELELIEAMIYGFDHPRINDSFGELNEDGMIMATKVMAVLANYDPSDYESETFNAQDREWWEYDSINNQIETESEDEKNHRVVGKKINSKDGELIVQLHNDYEWGGGAETFNAESKFDKLAKEIAADYRKKGKSPEEAMEIGEATAAKIGRAKYGKKKFSRMGKKAENFTNDLIPAFGLGVIGALVYSIFLNGKKE